MDSAKKAAFVKAMGRKKFAKGGMVKRPKKFADGGTALSGPTSSGTYNTAENPNKGFLGTVGSILGTNNNFVAGQANLQAGTNLNQLNQTYDQNQIALQGQQAFTNTLAPQATSAVANQNFLANQLAAMSQGEGPNPALAQLNQSTQKNVANQAALMAGQRGAAGNVGLIARQAAQQGAATQQEAVEQAATLKAEQQIAAQQNLGNLTANQINQTGQATSANTSAQQGEQNILEGAVTAFNNANVGMQSNLNNVNAQTAAGNQSAGLGILNKVGNVAGNLPVVGSLFKAHGGMIEDTHLKLAEMNAHSLGHAHKYAGGGQIHENPLVTGPIQVSGANHVSTSSPSSMQSSGPNIESTPSFAMKQPDMSSKSSPKETTKVTETVGKADPWEAGGEMAGDGDPFEHVSMAAKGGLMEDHFHKYFAKGGVVPAVVSPGEIYLSPNKVKEVIHNDADPMKIGEKIPGKAKVKGDSFKNDTVNKSLQEGGVVIPRHIATHKMARDKAALFVHKAIAKKKVRG